MTVEPNVGSERLAQLLAVGSESAELDYKAACNLRTKHDLVELVKDIGAMQVSGGYIIIGATNRGVPVGISPAEARLFDEATVRAKVLRYLDEPLSMLVGTHELEGKTLAIVFVGHHPNGCAIPRRRSAPSRTGVPAR